MGLLEQGLSVKRWVIRLLLGVIMSEVCKQKLKYFDHNVIPP